MFKRTKIPAPLRGFNFFEKKKAPDKTKRMTKENQQMWQIGSIGSQSFTIHAYIYNCVQLVAKE